MEIRLMLHIAMISFLLLAARSGAESEAFVSETLMIVSSESLQTQGMAMVLGNTMQDAGASVHVLLCDKAGDLALADGKSVRLRPNNVSPKQLLNKLRIGGANISVCALYLPNSEYSQADLADGVGVAKPPAIAALMLNKNIRVFNF